MAEANRRAYAAIGTASLVLILAFWAWLGFVVFSPDALYSGDIGVKYVQATSLVESGFRSLDMPYRAEFLDPERRFTPFRAPFVLNSNGETQAIFAPATAILQAIFVAIAGFPGIVVASFLSAAVALWAAWRLAPSPERAAMPILLGLGTPLWFYGVIGMDHAPSIALATVSLLVASRARTWRSALVAGLLLGAGATLRDETILLAPGLAAGLWLKLRGWKPIVWAGVGAVAMLAVAGAIEVFWFRRELAAHLQHAVHLLRVALNATDAPNPDVPQLQPMTLRGRYETVIWYWLLGYGDDRLIAIPSVVVLAALGARVFAGLRWPLVVALGMLIGFAAWDAWAFVQGPRWVAGLYRLSPFLVFAILPAPPRDGPADWLRTTAVIAFVGYLVLAFVGTDTTGGKSLGPRLLMPLLPIMAVSAWLGIVRHVKSTALTDRILGGCGLTLAALSLVLHLGSMMPAWAIRSADDGAVIASVRESQVPIVVADDMFTAQLMLPLYYKKTIFLADSQRLADELGELLTRRQQGRVLLVSRNLEGRIQLPGFQRLREETIGRMVIEEWRR